MLIDLSVSELGILKLWINIIQESFQNAEEIWQIKKAIKQINARTDKGKNGQIVSRLRNKMRQKDKKELGNCL